MIELHDPSETPLHEPVQVSSRMIITSALVLGLLIAGTLGLMFGLRAILLPTEKLNPENPGTAIDQPQSTPALNPHQWQQRIIYQNEQSELLHSYGWVDEKQNLAHIPIEQAMTLTVQKYKDEK